MEATSSSSSWPSVVGAVTFSCVFGRRVPRRTRATASLLVRSVNLLWIVVLVNPEIVAFVTPSKTTPVSVPLPSMKLLPCPAPATSTPSAMNRMALRVTFGPDRTRGMS